ncbi:MAG TPA: NapC/NirT family cytochrome c [Bacteroidales bacterium]|nr:NapC/NirT family cytochrome c [Bacteroidales bacterium]
MKLPPSARNWLTIIGSIIAGINLALIIILFIISTFFEMGSTNLGLFIYVILPGFLIMGLIIIPIGMIRERRRQNKMGDKSEVRLPRIDLNDPRHKNAFVIFTIATIIILFLSTLGSFEAFHITESVEFCGTLCHEVMEPEHIAYQHSPHANVTCVECHVGSGASWYVKSKISGLHQVIAVMTNDFPRPIETPLHDLRPARETCEKCHWPQKFYARSLRTMKYFLADSSNSEWDIMLQMKTGPEYSELGHKEGIHWHINPSIDVSYKSEHDKREIITVVEYTDKTTGQVHVYRNENLAVSDSDLAVSEKRSIDCIDCHNRPSHNYSSPSAFFDKVMITGDVSKKIPYIKQVAMSILSERFTNRDTALMKISDGITDYYKTEIGEYYDTNKDAIDKSIAAIQKEFNLNTFPSMGVRYDVYPEHIGHQESDGCFRCHNDQFRSETGRVISKDCNLCHTIIGQGKPDMMKYSTIRESLEFEHPVDIGTDWKDINCSECHKSLY